MNFSEITKMVVERIQKLERQNFKKIMGIILLNDPTEIEMLQLANGPERTLISTIEEVKTMLGNLQNSRSVSSPLAFQIPPEYWNLRTPSDLGQNTDFAPRTYQDSVQEECSLIEQPNFFTSDENYHSTRSRRSPSLPEFPTGTCYYYYRGYCKHGGNCRYFHGPSHSRSFSSCLNELQSKDHGCSLRSLEKLETEITELLRARRGVPVPIDSLPRLYYEKYGKNLEADGYFIESQRHGKAGFNLTKLLARLKNSIRLIDRPHGQHSVILAEAAPKYLDNRNERNEARFTAMGSHKIYLTFPAESSFTLEDIFNYFKQFGPVSDVRIPYQEKRMFGFVSFVYPETVSEILMKQVPHYICGDRVFVKPYRTQAERSKSATNHPSHYVDFDSEFRQEFPLDEHFYDNFEALNIPYPTDGKTRNTSKG
ncbi:zinc finger CCCH domain-containing protein 54-like isoform X2 [Phalaenopsis equestris]|uniref:zinc finger CCCH domain-containing protein 54-like isoform X2 n=1 Tax=Phalaenopsis equestris TaxID=78828 RepID=UPI0009E47584|nr:zinc finger CCCH domain-containing protein 54-like isoform X2 [Phalaenopsis equestris]